MLAIGVVQENNIEVGLVMHFQPTQFAVADDRKISLAPDRFLDAFGNAILFLQCLAGQAIYRFQYHFSEIAKVVADLAGVDFQG